MSKYLFLIAFSFILFSSSTILANNECGNFENLDDRSPENVQEILDRAIKKAVSANVQEVMHFITIQYEASNIIARNFTSSPGISPRAALNIYAIMEDGDHGPVQILVGVLNLQKVHLGKLKSSNEIAEEINKMINSPRNQ